MTPDGKTFDPETVTDKQLVQYEQAIDRGLTEADAMRLTEHEYNGFQANAIIAAALNPAVGENVLDALATPKYTAAQMTAIAKIAIRGGDFARFLDPQMDARRMEAAYLVVAHGGSDLPVERLSRSQLLTINNILVRGHIPYETVHAIAKPAFTPESMEVIAAAMENARHDPYTGEQSLTEAQVARIMNPDYRPEQQIALLTAMRGQTPVADLSDADFAGLFPASLYVNEEGLFTCPPNRAIFATEEMAKAGYLSQLDYSKVVEMGDFYTVLNGDIVAVGFDPETGESRSLTDGEIARVEGYFTVISRPGSGAKAVDDIRHGITPGGYDISVESHDCTSGRNALAADAPAMDAPGKDNQNIG